MTDHTISHEQASEALEALALDALDASERDEVLAHVAQCSTCSAELEELRATAAQLLYAIKPAVVSATERQRMRSRLISRAIAERAATAAVKTPATASPILVPAGGPQQASHISRSWFASPSSWVAAAASIVAIASLWLLAQASNERDVAMSRYQLAMSNERLAGPGMLDSLRNAISDRDRMIANLTGPQVAVVTLAANNSPAMSARMFWDQSVNAWTFVAHNLPQPRAGRTYQLWLVTANQKINAGTFNPASNGDALVRATYALPKNGLAAIAVTDEPAEGSSQPTTVPFIVGAVTK